MSDVSVITADDPAFEDAVAIRKRVFVEEQDVPLDRELDGRDDEAAHFLLRVAGAPVGTARLRAYDPGVGKVERVAVLDDYRGQGHGASIVAAIEAHAGDAGYETLVLDAQTHVGGFYEKLEYEVVSDEPFEDAGIPHLRMRKSL